MKLETKTNPTWCPGCGNYSILAALKGAIIELGLEPHNVVIVSGIGCHGHLPQWIAANGFETIHGRTLPLAQAVKLANHDLTVIAVAGDGDCYDEGMSHFIHACRRNIDITVLVHNNGVFALTTGQTSPTSAKGFISKSTPLGSPEYPINPLALSLEAGASFIARGFSGELRHLQSTIVKAISHKGFSLVDIFQPCVVWNKTNTNDFWKKNTYKLEDSGHNPSGKEAAWHKVHEHNPWPIGVLYEATYQMLPEHLPQLAKQSLVEQPINNISIKQLLEEFE